MSVSQAFRHSGFVKIATSAYIDGVTSIEIAPNVSLASLRAGGVDMHFNAAQGVAPVITFRTTNIKAALDACAFSGRAVASGTEFVVYKVAHQDGGLFKSGSNHESYTVNKGIMIPTALSFPHGGVATLELMVIAVYNGTAAPIVRATGVALPAVTQTQVAWTAGPYALEGVTVEGQGGSLNFGLNPSVLSANGEVYPTFAAIDGRAPSFELGSHDLTLQGTIGSDSFALTQDALIYLRKMDLNGQRVDDETAEHILFTVAQGIVAVGQVSSGESGPDSMGFRLVPSFDQTNAVVQLDTTAAVA